MSTTVLSPTTQLEGLLCWNFIEYQRTYLEMSTQFILCLQNWLEIISKCLLYIVHESLGHKRNICKLFNYLGSYNRPHQTVRSFGVWFWDSRLKFQCSIYTFFWQAERRPEFWTSGWNFSAAQSSYHRPQPTWQLGASKDVLFCWTFLFRCASISYTHIGQSVPPQLEEP